MKHRFLEYHPKNSKNGYWKCCKCAKKLLLDSNGYIKNRSGIETKCGTAKVENNK